MNRKIRIGTRDSKLALWQAHTVQALLEARHISTELVPVKSEGDLDLVTPLYAMGVQGVFTKTLDAYLLSDKIDIAVHSLKDVPTQFAQGLMQAAVLKRGPVHDIFVPHPSKTSTHGHAVIGTGSVRRKAQWLNRYPDARIDNLRGNVQTRLQKLADSDWDGAIFAAAGLERIGLRPEYAQDLDWMLPAPSQGAVMIACRATDGDTLEACAPLNDADTALCVQIERDFLKTLMGGCSTPISAYAELIGDTIRFRGNILSTDGKEKMEIERTVPRAEASGIGFSTAQELLEQGADRIVQSIRNLGA
ncbi:hydroxymethylbilane synthase [Rurimicrobium arvi]|uniref:Porphobilinogen deaminase n=1 Tax=Rurimicrobium arvi TaxID=2049916 RepID=A0ABP8MZC6_9BACT